MVTVEKNGVSLLKKKPLNPYACDTCKSVTRKNKFKWESFFVNIDPLIICRECAYREAYGSKGSVKAKKEKWLEKEN